MIKQGKTDKDFVFDIFNYIILGICALTVIYPLYFIAIASVSSPEMVTTGMVILLPREITYEGYYKLLNNSQVWIGYRNTFFYTVMGTLLNVVLTLTAAFALAKKDLGGKGVIMGFLVFTMLFHGGIIPRYLVVKQVGIINTVWALILPNAVSVWNIIIARTFFQSTIPDELGEAAYIDGCSNTKYFWNIVLPLSPALIAVLVLFYGVNHWNAFFDALMFINDNKLYPLQLVLRNILIMNQFLAQQSMDGDAETIAVQQRAAELIKYALIMVASIPMLMLYPFLQKYFTKGVMIGAIKG